MCVPATNANETKRNTATTISKLNSLLLTNQTSSNHLAECLRTQTDAITKELLVQHAANEKHIGENSVAMKQLSADSADILKVAHASLLQQKERSTTHHRLLVEMV